MLKHVTLFGIVLLALASFSYCQVSCSGLLDSPAVITSDVNVNGGSCTISGINITGSVSITSGGQLSTQGTVFIFGSVSGDGSGNINLGGILTVNGDVNVINAPGTTITLGSDANVGKVSLEGAAAFVGQGTTGSFSGKGSSDVTLTGATINGGGVLLEGGTADLNICGTTITGGISFKEVTGDFNAGAGAGCAANTISGAISVEKGTGDVAIDGISSGSSDLIVVEQNGNVSLENASLSDVSFQKVSGNISLNKLTLDSDGTLQETTGNIMLENSFLSGDFSITETTGSVILNKNDFGVESVTVSKGTGSVTVEENSNFSINIGENGPVTFANNKATNAEINANTGGVQIDNNEIVTLSCSSNNPAPAGTGNTISGSATGQCAGF